MNLNLITELWASMKPLIATSDRHEAAEAFVNVLIENDLDPKEIKKAFKKDANIIKALGFFLEDEAEDEDDAAELYFDDEDDEDEYL